MASDPRAAGSHEQTARRFQLYTEIFADRGSLCVTGDVNPVVAGSGENPDRTRAGQRASLLEAGGRNLRQGQRRHRRVVASGGVHPRAGAGAVAGATARGATPHISEMIEGADGARRAGSDRPDAADTEHPAAAGILSSAEMVSDPGRAGACETVLRRLSASGDAGRFGRSRIEVQRSQAARVSCATCCSISSPPTRNSTTCRWRPRLDLSRQLELDAQFEKLAAKELKLKVRDVRSSRNRPPRCWPRRRWPDERADAAAVPQVPRSRRRQGRL